MGLQDRAIEVPLRDALRVALVLLVLWGVSVPTPALGAVEARGIDNVCPAPFPGTLAFPDGGETHGAAIRCAADYGLVTGYEDGRYGPFDPLTRAQMATVLRRFVEASTGAALPSAGPDPFDDIAGSVHRDSIRAVHAAGVVSGRADGGYDPATSVTRGQMARFLVSALDRIVDPETPDSFPPAVTTNDFDDVPGTTFQAEIRALAAVGVVQGTTDTTFEPSALVTRGQLATFLMRAADLLDEEGAWEPPEEPPGEDPDAEPELDPEPAILEVTVQLTDDEVLGIVNGRVVSGQGQLGASATAELTFNEALGTVRYELDFSNVDGTFGQGAGFLLETPDTGVESKTLLQLATGAQLQAQAGTGSRILFGQLVGTDLAGRDVNAAIAAVLANPAGHYLTVRTDDQSNGAVRGPVPAS